MCRSILVILLSLSLFSLGCSSSSRQTKVYQTGEKAEVDKLVYTVIDTQIHPRLGEDGETPRIPQNRFYTVQVAVSSGNNTEVSIPAMQLVDDSGKAYPELADGTNVPHWLGVVRRVSPAQTERGVVVFDAPAAHYKLKLTDETDPDDVYIDLPLSFVHEQMGNEDTPVAPGAEMPGPPPDEKKAGKKK